MGEFVVRSVLEDININTTFRDLDGHMTETGVTENHVFLLIKSVTRNYLKIKMHHMAKEANQSRMKNEQASSF